jgi:hypothetical protein
LLEAGEEIKTLTFEKLIIGFLVLLVPSLFYFLQQELPYGASCLKTSTKR